MFGSTVGIEKEQLMADISLKNITVQFPGKKKGFRLFSSFNLLVKSGEFICIFGRSGIGKTTLLKIISGILVPNEGKMVLGDKYFGRKKARIGVVFQEPRLFPWMTVRENVIFTAKRRYLDQKELEYNAETALKTVGAINLANRFPRDLSGGESQRISLARALAVKPDILLLDEPFSHLDELTARQLRQMFLQITRGLKTTVVFVTHNPYEAVYLADRILVLRRRHLVKNIVVDRPVDINKISYESFFSKNKFINIVKDLISSI